MAYLVASGEPHTTQLMFFVYVIRSKDKHFRYVGITNNVERRLNQHNRGASCSTKIYAPFNLIHQESVVNMAEARAREKFLKSGVGRKFLNGLEL